MKTFQQFVTELKTIPYIGAKPHKIYNKGKITNIGSGRAVPRKSPSSSGGNGDSGDGGE